jgi:hypothetical protein
MMAMTITAKNAVMQIPESLWLTQRESVQRQDAIRAIMLSLCAEVIILREEIRRTKHEHRTN